MGDGPTGPVSDSYLPMLASSWPRIFDDPSWWFEVKWDGYRCIASNTAGQVVLKSRRGLDLGARFPGVAELALPKGWVLDGEVVALDDAGRPDFGRLQRGGAATYVVFDVLAGPGGTVIDQPIEERRRLLMDLDLPDTVVTTEPVHGDGTALFEAVKEQGLEGVVAKRAGSPYQPGRRSSDWRKVAHRRRIRAVIGGWLPGEGSRASTFGSVLVGLVSGSQLRFVGAVGSGFSDGQLGPIAATLDQLARDTPPFGDTAAIPRQARWVEPAVVIAVEFKEWTRDGRLRAPVFKGVEDGSWAGVTWEAEGPG